MLSITIQEIGDILHDVHDRSRKGTRQEKGSFKREQEKGKTKVPELLKLFVFNGQERLFLTLKLMIA